MHHKQGGKNEKITHGHSFGHFALFYGLPLCINYIGSGRGTESSALYGF